MLRRINILFIFLILTIQTILAQEPEPGMNFKPDEPDAPLFYYDVIEYPSVNRDSINIEIIIKAPFDGFQFVKNDTGFTANYEVSVLLLDENEIQAASKIWKQNIHTQKFKETNSQEHFDVSKINFRVAPNKFFLTLGILDMDTRKSGYRKKTMDYKEFYAKPVVLSKINIIEKVVQGIDGIAEEIPSVIGSISDDNPDFLVSFSVLSGGGEGTIRYIIYDQKNKVVTEGNFDREFQQGLTQEKLTIPKEKLTFNRYRLEVIVKIGNNETKGERLFQLRWLGMSNLIDNLDQAIDQLKYIASSSQIRAMKKAKQEAKKDLFVEFWNKRDPTPNTPDNELMNEYYKRVRYTIEHYSGFMPGWKTDMGMIFILFGPPNDIERHPFEIQTKPYEIWYYYEINRSFVFVDESGFGEYRLISPYYDLEPNY
ncbi:MAG: GWxTD domain-containing protein [Candidatus Neomarinimicrobiota bacterium]